MLIIAMLHIPISQGQNNNLPKNTIEYPVCREKNASNNEFKMLDHKVTLK